MLFPPVKPVKKMYFKKSLRCDDNLYLYSPGEALRRRARSHFANTEFKCKYDANEHILSVGHRLWPSPSFSVPQFMCCSQCCCKTEFI